MSAPKMSNVNDEQFNSQVSVMELSQLTSNGGAPSPRENGELGVNEPMPAGSRRPSGFTNERLLLTAFATFLSFALLQLFFAILARSQAMMGDSAAMIVDSFTYIFNWLAERRKNRLDELVQDDPKPGRKRRKLELQAESFPPLVSVTTLLAVIVLVYRKSIQTLKDELGNRNSNSASSPNAQLMMIFSIVNLFLDLLNVACFARAKHLLGYKIRDCSCDEPALPLEPVGACGAETKTNQLPDIPLKQPLDDNACSEENGMGPSPVPQNDVVGSNSSHKDGCDTNKRGNLNMCSAYTHVLADTLRSIAVIVAAVVAQLAPQAVTPTEADSTAAIIVSTIILVSLVPLLRGLTRRLVELRRICREERLEARDSQRRVAEVKPGDQD